MLKHNGRPINWREALSQGKRPDVAGPIATGPIASGVLSPLYVGKKSLINFFPSTLPSHSNDLLQHLFFLTPCRSNLLLVPSTRFENVIIRWSDPRLLTKQSVKWEPTHNGVLRSAQYDIGSQHRHYLDGHGAIKKRSQLNEVYMPVWFTGRYINRSRIAIWIIQRVNPRDYKDTLDTKERIIYSLHF